MALVMLLGQLLCVSPASAADLTIAVAVPSFNANNARAIVFNGSAALVGNALRLTPAVERQAGSAFWRGRVSLSNQRSFSSYFVLSFSGANAGFPFGGDGIVFAIQTQSNTAGGSGGGIGFQNIKPSIGIEFDTYQNTDLLDPAGDHVGLDINGVMTSVATNVTSSLSLPGALEGHTWHVWVDYNGATHKLQVRMAPTNDRTSATLVLDVTRNLANDIGPDVYVGFTAGTGGAFENHDVQTFFFANNYQPIDTSAPQTVYHQAPSQLSIISGVPAIRPGGSTSITVTVRDILNSAAPGQLVTLTTSLGTLTTYSGVTDSNGQITLTMNGGNTFGVAKVRASVAGGLYGEVNIPVAAYVDYLPITTR